jgi:predicted 3-demethylubiquinone-9 3-methyltransferase (glyoxalase superfamily)
MSLPKSKITPFLWFDTQAEEAAQHYTSIFKNARITAVHRHGGAVHDVMPTPDNAPGKVMMVAFELDGSRFLALNGGPMHAFTPAVSLYVECEDQAEVDHFWERLGEGGDPARQSCGWLADKFGLSWQIVPRAFGEMMEKGDREQTERVMKAMLGMAKMDVEALKRAFDGVVEGSS